MAEMRNRPGRFRGVSSGSMSMLAAFALSTAISDYFSIGCFQFLLAFLR